MQFVHQWIELQAQRSPAAPALVFGDQSLDYAALNRLANQWAHRLRTMGVGPDCRVALCMHRGIDLMVALLATLKAGGAYVALDPGYPADRLAYMLQDAKPQVVLTHADLADRLSSVAATRVEFVAGPDQVAGEPVADVDPAAIGLTPEHLAYVIYTSGSTGRPKGVLNQHSGLANLLPQLGEQFEVDATSRVLQFASPSFDASVLEIAMALCYGGTLCLAPREAMLPGEPLLETLNRHRVTHLTVPPSALSVLDAGAELTTVRTLVVAGEACPPSVVRRWAARHRMINIYGPTETTIYVTAHPCDAAQSGSTPIGRPIQNVPIYILDAGLQPVGPGSPGEIYVGGPAVARGYLDRPELTAERFVPDHFAKATGSRLYKTGDLGRWLNDGSIEYLGRGDHQVKIRGYRIELGEIEARLADCAEVREAVVLAREDVPGDKRLVAYLVASVAVEPLDIDGLRSRLAAFLPRHMLPSAWVVLDRFPLTPNGKVDRAALRPPAQADIQAAPYVAPQGPIESALAAIWCEVLHVTRVGRDDNFFALGGHSLLATQVASRVRENMRMQLPLRMLFDWPTLQAVAARLIPRDGVGRESTDGESARIRRVARDGPLPTSYSQRRMWLIQQLNPQTTAYNVPFALRMHGALDRDCLERALDDVARRHEAFRTRFEAIDGEPMQVIDGYRSVALGFFDLSRLPAAQRLPDARRLLGELAAEPFDLRLPGLHRTSLLRVDDTDHVLLWLIHHAICDYWAGGILMRDVQRVYAALLEGRTCALEPLEIEYADFAVWQREQAARAQQALQLEFWRARLSGLQPLNLPTDLQRRGPSSGKGGSVFGRLTAGTLDELRSFSARHGVTPFMTLLACFQVMLARYSGQLDFAVGTPIANRHRLESEALVGTLVNTLVMRADLSGEQSFAQFLSQVQERSLEAYAHQDASFERLVEELASGEERGESPLVRVMFNLINAPFEVNGFPGLQVEFFDFDQGAAQFDLSLTVETELFGIVQIDYASDVFVQATAQRMLEGFVELLQEALANPHRKCLDYTILSTDSRRELAAWQGAGAPPAKHRNVADWLWAAAAVAGERIALIDADTSLTYAQLEASVNRLASELGRRGVERGSRVGLCIERSRAMVVAQLAILRAGAAYVPLDPTYPVERLAMMAEDAGLCLLVTASDHAQLLAWPREKSLLLDQDGATPASVPVDDASVTGPASAAGPDDPAYVIYTSGSTGRPNGVVVPHRAVLNFLASMAQQPGLKQEDRLVAVTTLSFDIAVLEILLPLCVGAVVVLTRPDEAQDGRALRACLEKQRATVMQATPATWRMLIEAGWPGAPGFKALIGGETLPLDLAQQLLDRVGEMWNMYGPTETTVWSTCWRVERPEAGICIGRPIAATRVHVLNDRQQLCPVGVPGEICIAGEGVALGYLNRPELSAARFVSDPFSAAPAALMYRTGDHGRWRHDGQLEHLGRLDLQVKVRGHRIELGEIEANLATHSQVARAVVVVREDRPGDPRIVAYVLARDGVPSRASLRDHLRMVLPQYMLPQHYVSIDAVPLLPNGKIDRRSLPLPALDEQAPEIVQVVPSSPAELAIAGIWQRLLEIDAVGVEDNFFDLGGHSLLAIRAAGEIEKSLGWRLSPQRFIFETLGQLATKPGLAESLPSHEGVRPAGVLGKMVAGLKNLRGAKT